MKKDKIKEIKRKTFRGEFKQNVVEEMRKNKLSYKKTARLYNIDDKMAARWERIYLEEGLEQLYIEKRGRALKKGSVLKGEEQNIEKSTEEDLMKEVKP